MRFCLYTAVGAVLFGFAAYPAGIPQGTGRRVALAPKVVQVVKTDPRSGQLVHTIVLTAKISANKPVAQTAVPQISAAAQTPADMRNLVEETAKNYDVPLALVDSVIQVESNYDAFAVSPKGAQGLMQLMPATAKRFGVTDSFDAKQNIDAGVRYLKFLQQTFKDDRLAIAAYNAGEGAVQKYGAIPPYPETISYVEKVGKKYGKKRPAEAAATVAHSDPEDAPQAPEYRRLAQFIDAKGIVYLTTQ